MTFSATFGAPMVLALDLSGTAQIWERACDAEGHCGLPQPVGERRTLTARIDEPTPGVPVAHLEVWSSGNLKIRLGVFQKAADSGDATSYTAYQVTLLAGDSGRLVAECSSFEPAQRGEWFPVGACSGELPGSEGSRRIGVTLRRLRVPVVPTQGPDCVVPTQGPDCVE